MPDNEILHHLEQELLHYKDRILSRPGQSDWWDRIQIRDLNREIEVYKARIQAAQEAARIQEAARQQLAARQQTLPPIQQAQGMPSSDPSASVKLAPIQGPPQVNGSSSGSGSGSGSGLNGGSTSQFNSIVAISFLRVSLFKEIVTYLKPLFTLLLILISGLIMINIPFITDLYNLLVSLSSEYIVWITGLLFLIISFLIKLLFLIRRANNTIENNNKVFEYIYHYKSSILIYSFIILLSLWLVYASGIPL